MWMVVCLTFSCCVERLITVTSQSVPPASCKQGCSGGYCVYAPFFITKQLLLTILWSFTHSTLVIFFQSKKYTQLFTALELQHDSTPPYPTNWHPPPPYLSLSLSLSLSLIIPSHCLQGRQRFKNHEKKNMDRSCKWWIGRVVICSQFS